MILIAVQCVIFAWIYGLDHFIPVLNENGIFKVGKLWKTLIKYVLPIFLIVIWVMGIIKLFSSANAFELIIDIIIVAVVLLLSYVMTRTRTRS